MEKTAMTERDPSLAKVISLNEFRQQLMPEEETYPRSEILADLNYEFVKYPEYTVYRHVVEHIEPQAANSNIVIAVRDTEIQETPYIFMAKEGNDRYIAIDRGTDEVESLTLDFCTYDPEESNISDQLKTYYTASLIGKALLNGGKRIDFNEAHNKLDMPQIGEANIKLDYDDRFIEVTKWRAAGGIALHAVAGKNANLQNILIGHLAHQLDYRMHYDQGRQQFAELVGVGADDECSITDRMLGICNPLSRMNLRAIMANAKSSDGWIPLV
jgi:hypothetical protein